MISARRTSSSAALGLAALLLAPGARADVLNVPAEFPTVAFALAAAQPGDEIVLAAGSYDEIIDVDGLQDVVIRGQGQVVLTGGSGSTTSLRLMNCTGVTVDHLRVGGTSEIGIQVGNGTGVTLRRLRVQGPTSRGILVSSTTGSLVERCIVEGPVERGIVLQNSEESRISRCTVMGSSEAGIGLELGEDCVVERCRVIDGGSQGISLGLGIGESGCQARDCVVIDASEVGLFGAGADMLLMDNRVQGGGTAGIQLASGSVGGLVQDNRVNAGVVGLLCDATGALVRDNRVIKPEGAGITCAASDIVLTGNRVLHAGLDAFVVDATVDGGSFTGCKALHAGEDSYQVDGTHLVFTGNVSLGAALHGFSVPGTDNLFVGNFSHGGGSFPVATLVGNTFLDNDFQAEN